MAAAPEAIPNPWTDPMTTPIPEPGASGEGTPDGRLTETAKVLRAHGVGVKGGISGNKVAQRAGVSAETVNRQLRPLRPGQKPIGMDKETIDAVADAVPMPRVELQNAVLADAGFVITATATPGEGVEAVLARLPGMSDHDRRLVLAELAALMRDDEQRGQR